MARRKRRVAHKDLRAGEIFIAATYGDFVTLKRIARELAREEKTKRNPTPLLRDLKHIAWLEVRRYGRAEAHKAALAIVNTAKVYNDPRTERRYKLLARLILQVKAKKHAKRKTMYDKLIEEFGTTDAMAARGFILEDGTCLNLGQYDDHRIINCVYPDSQKAEQRYGSRYGAFVNLCKKYNMIRWIPESKQCEVFVEPTRHQIAAMRELAENGMLREIEVHYRGTKSVLEAQDADTLVAGVEAIYA
jgi:hypothetical protein